MSDLDSMVRQLVRAVGGDDRLRADIHAMLQAYSRREVTEDGQRAPEYSYTFGDLLQGATMNKDTR
jgi:hypothetical protein